MHFSKNKRIYLNLKCFEILKNVVDKLIYMLCTLMVLKIFLMMLLGHFVVFKKQSKK